MSGTEAGCGRMVAHSEVICSDRSRCAGRFFVRGQDQLQPWAGGPLNYRSGPHSSQFHRDEWASHPSRPFRLDFDDSSTAGCVVAKATPPVFFRRGHQSSLHRIAMNIADDLRPGLFSADVPIEIDVLPESLVTASSSLLLCVSEVPSLKPSVCRASHS